MTFFEAMTEHTQVAISKDQNKIVLANGPENYIFEEKDNQLFQNNLPELRNKIVWRIEPYFDSFIFVMSNEYDTNL